MRRRGCAAVDAAREGCTERQQLWKAFCLQPLRVAILARTPRSCRLQGQFAIRLELVQGQNPPAQGSQALATNVGSDEVERGRFKRTHAKDLSPSDFWCTPRGHKHTHTSTHKRTQAHHHAHTHTSPHIHYAYIPITHTQHTSTQRTSHGRARGSMVDVSVSHRLYSRLA